MSLCGQGVCNCAIGSDTLTISGDGTGDNPWMIEGQFPTIATSTSRPLSPFDGQVIYETDTQMYAAWRSPPGIWIYQSSGVLLTKSHSATASATSTVSWGTQVHDRGGYWSSGSTVTIPPGLGGPHLVTGSVSGAAWTMPSSVLLTMSPGDTRAVGTAASALIHNTAVRTFAAGDTIVMGVTNGGAVQTVTARLEVVRLIW